MNKYLIEQIAKLLGIQENSTIQSNIPVNNDNYSVLENNTDVTLFVNGYRYNMEVFSKGNELPNTNNQIYIEDVYDYWEGLDQLFSQNLFTKINYFVDGHFSATTSNHKNVNNFIKSLMSSLTVSGIKLQNDTDYMKVYHKENYVQLNTVSNKEGFDFRFSEGRNAGYEFVNKLNEINPYGKLLKINIVAHSMGFAYSQGIIDVLGLHKNIVLNKYYIIAPENAEAGRFNPEKFQEVWQYGSQDCGVDREKLWEQDGLAPQSSVFEQNDLDESKYGRIFIPKNLKERGFIQSHLIKNYRWIFDVLKKNDKGFVKA